MATGGAGGGSPTHRRAARSASSAQPVGQRTRSLAVNPGLCARRLPQWRARCHTGPVRATVVLGVQGRLVVPAEARKELGLAAGDELVLHTEAGRLVLERREDAGKRLRGLYASPATDGAVDDLLAERRHAAVAE